MARYRLKYWYSGFEELIIEARDLEEAHEIADDYPESKERVVKEVNAVHTIAATHDEAKKRVQDGYESHESCYRSEISDDGKPTKIYFIVASNEYQAKFIARELYRSVSRVRMLDAKPVIPPEV